MTERILREIERMLAHYMGSGDELRKAGMGEAAAAAYNHAMPLEDLRDWLKSQPPTEAVEHALCREVEKSQLFLRQQLEAQLQAADAKVAAMREVLKSIADGPHEGEGFCYAAHTPAIRPCRCHVAVARAALGEP